jgi:hypothetical protein
MIKYLRTLYYSFPVQLVILHFKKFQVLLVFWGILFSTLKGDFMRSFGADALFFSPEYLGQVSPLSMGIVGVATGVFIMSWNITTFILFSRHFRFLATTTKPFLKYCINNFILPVSFLIFYFVNALHFDITKELMNGLEIIFLLLGFISGLGLLIVFSLLYFFRADRSIVRQMAPVIGNPRIFRSQYQRNEVRLSDSRLIKVLWYFNSPVRIKKVRDVSHYSREFVENIFNRHHFSAILSVFTAFIFLIIVGFFMDSPFFQIPAASSVLIFFAILISLTGALSYFLQNWSIPFLVLLFIVLNLLYQNNIIDPSNKAYGLNYTNPVKRPAYSQEGLMSICGPEQLERDKKNMLQILEAWKKKQHEQKPILYIINTSGGGNRSATFTMHVLQAIDSLSNGELMKKAFLITGASGGMFGAAYFRELALLKEQGDFSINLQNPRYVDDISDDLLNPLFSSFVARDLASPAQKFKVDSFEYVKDRGYAFEQKLALNTHGVLNRQLKDLYLPEKNVEIPLMFFNSVVTRDSRSMIISPQGSKLSDEA